MPGDGHLYFASAHFGGCTQWAEDWGLPGLDWDRPIALLDTDEVKYAMESALSACTLVWPRLKERPMAEFINPYQFIPSHRRPRNPRPDDLQLPTSTGVSWAT